MKKLFALLMAVTLTFHLVTPVFAEDPEQANADTLPQETEVLMDETEGPDKTEEPAETEGPDETEEPTEADAPSAATETDETGAAETVPTEAEPSEETGALIRVTFIRTPADLTLTVYAEDTDVEIDPQEDDTYLLAPGKYTYLAELDGYISEENTFTVSEANETTREISVELQGADVEDDASFDSGDYSLQLSRIDELYERIKKNGGFFTVNQKGCGIKAGKSHSGCDNCYLLSIVNSNWFSTEFGSNVTCNKFAMNTGGGAKSCTAFASFAGWFVNRGDDNDSVSTASRDTGDFSFAFFSSCAKPGDSILMVDGERSHNAIFISCTEQGIYVLDSNYAEANGDPFCEVRKHTIRYSAYRKATISHLQSKQGGHTQQTAPSAPTNFKAVYVDNARAKLSWSASSGATSYEVQYWSVGSNAWKTDTSYSSGTSYTSTGLKNYSSWTFRVRAVNSAGKSDWVSCNYEKTHTHSYKQEFEAAHPHKVYMKCSSCGDWYYTGATTTVDSCTQCHPPVQQVYLDLKGYLDGRDSDSLENFGTCDVYINDVKVADDCTDFYRVYPVGTKYSIKDIRATDGHKYIGEKPSGKASVSFEDNDGKTSVRFEDDDGTLSGTLKKDTEVALEYKSMVLLNLGGYLDGQESDNLDGYGTCDVYIDGKKVADDCTDFYAAYPKGSKYTIADIKPTQGYQYNGVYRGNVSGELSERTDVILNFSVARSGSCGENLRWRIDDGGTLTISGTGPMNDYKNFSNEIRSTAPWAELSPKKLILEEGITRIGKFAFYACTGLTGNLTLPKSLTSIGDDAFLVCWGLTGDLYLPDSITDIGEYAFSGCNGFDGKLTLPSGLKIIRANAFYGCSKFTGDLVIPESVASVQSSAFSGWSNLKAVTILGRDTDIRSSGLGSDDNGKIAGFTIRGHEGSMAQTYAYENGFTFIALKEPTLHSGTCGDDLTWSLNTAGTLTITGTGAMWDYEWCQDGDTVYSSAPWTGLEITDIALDEGITRIGDCAFLDCRTIFAPLSLPSTLQEIGDAAFSGCYGLYGELYLPESINAIGACAFQGCEGLTGALNLPSGISYIGSAVFNGCSGLTGTISIPKNVQYIGDWAFRDCIGFTGKLVVPNNVVVIDEYAFAGCAGIEQVEIPADLQSIGEGAFEDCASLADVYYAGSLNQWNQISIGANNAPLLNATLHCTGSDDIDPRPLAQSVTLWLDGEVAPKSTTIDLNDYLHEIPQLNLTATVLPEEAVQSVTWSSSAPKVATVEEDGHVTVVSPGTAVIKAIATDGSKKTAQITLNVIRTDRSPRLGTSTLTLNGVSTAGVQVDLVETYGNRIQNVRVDDDRLEAEYEDNVLTLYAREAIAKGTCKVVLTADTDNGTYTYPLTIKVTQALPKLTFKQSNKFDLFYRDSESTLTITGGEVESAAFIGNSDFALENEDGQWFIRYADPENIPAKPSTKATLSVLFAGYNTPVTKSVTIATVNTSPKLKLSPSSSVLNTVLTEALEVRAQLAGTDDDNLSVWTDTPGAEVYLDDGTLTIELSAAKAVTVNVYVQSDSWAKPVKLTHKVSVTTKKPTLKAINSTLKLNSYFPSETASTGLILSQGNLSLSMVELTSTAKAGAAATESEKLSVSYDLDSEEIVAEILDSSIKNGTYSFTCVGTLEDGTAISGGTIKVSVTNTLPKAKLSTSTVKLNKRLTGEEATVKVNLTGGNGYTVTGFENLPDFMWYEDGILTVTLPEQSGTYPLYATVSRGGEEAVLPTAVKLTVQVYDKVPSFRLSAKGKLDVLDPDSKIIYTPKLTNALGTATDVELTGASADLFDAEVVNGTIHLTLAKSGDNYSTKATYKIVPLLTICDQQVKGPALSIKVTQSALKLASLSNRTVYTSQATPLVQTLHVTAPAAAEIGDVTLNAKTSAALRSALDTAGGLQSHGATIAFPAKAFTGLKPGNYTVILDIIPVNAASDSKPTQAKFTLTVKK